MKTTRPQLNTQLDAVIYFISKMDAEMIHDLLNEDYSYQDYNKWHFTRKLGDLFFEFKSYGDQFLIIDQGRCHGCSFGKIGFSFVGNKSGHFIDFVFETNSEGVITDMYECGELCHRDLNHRKRNRLFLDHYDVFDVDPDEMDDQEDQDDFYDDYDDDFPLN